MHFPKRLVAALFGLVLTATFALAQGYCEPARGTPERKALMDVMRPVAESYLGAPVEFVVQELRVSGDLATAFLFAQRPGGGKIDLATTPWGKSGYYSEPIDYPGIQAILRRQGGSWIVFEHAFSPTDVWLSDPKYCGEWAPVIPELCG